MAETIGLIGLGRMGSALAARAASEGMAVRGWTRSGGDPVLAERSGWRLLGALEDAVTGADILVLSLFDRAAVEDILNRLAALDLSGKLIVETSTVSPDIVRRLNPGIAAAGGRLIDAPISGGPELVTAGRIGLFIGGDEEDVARFLPVAQKLSDRIAHVGDLGAGAAMKIVNNVALAGAYGAALEAMELGRAMGLDLVGMLDVLEKSPGTSPMFKSRVPLIRGDEDRIGFTIDGAVKDAAVFIGEAERCGVTLPALSAIGSVLVDAAADGLGAEDVAALIRHRLS